MISLLVYALILGIVFWGLYYIINNLAPEPVRRILNVVLVVVFVIVLVWFLLSLVGGAPTIHPLLR